MSERRNRRRLHARARALGIPIDQVPRRGAPVERPGRSFSTPSGDVPRWRDSETPDRDVPGFPDEPVDWNDGDDWNDSDGADDFGPCRSRSASCCEVVLTRRVMDGGTIVMLTTHSAECPVWSSGA
jgi:hypothetical protein